MLYGSPPKYYFILFFSISCNRNPSVTGPELKPGDRWTDRLTNLEIGSRFNVGYGTQKRALSMFRKLTSLEYGVIYTNPTNKCGVTKTSFLSRSLCSTVDHKDDEVRDKI